MLPNHSALHIAEIFRALEALHPGRIDLGVGRAPGSDTLTALALRGSKDRLGADDFPEQLGDLFAFGSGHFPENHRFRAIRAMPEEVPLPPVWILGSSDYGARLAGKLGLGFGFAHHFSPDWVYQAARAYHENFRPSEQMERPNLILTISVVCAETDAEAERLASTLELVGLWRSRGHFAPLPSPEEALAYPFTPWDREQAQRHRSQHFVGAPATVRAQILQLAEQTGAAEIMVSTMMHGHFERRRSYELLAQAFDLPTDGAGADMRQASSASALRGGASQASSR
jgi:luciferase family oxidoreductase group 1